MPRTPDTTDNVVGMLVTDHDPNAPSDAEIAARNRQTLARYVIDRREDAGLSQSELASRAGITRSLMSAIENGKIGLPSIDKRRALAEALRIRHVDLLVAAGEITVEELGSGTPRDFTHYPELQRDIETLSPDAADALHDFMYFLVASPPKRAGLHRPSQRAAWLDAYRVQAERFHRAASEDSEA